VVSKNCGTKKGVGPGHHLPTVSTPVGTYQTFEKRTTKMVSEKGGKRPKKNVLDLGHNWGSPRRTLSHLNTPRNPDMGKEKVGVCLHHGREIGAALRLRKEYGPASIIQAQTNKQVKEGKNRQGKNSQETPMVHRERTAQKGKENCTPQPGASN